MSEIRALIAQVGNERFAFPLADVMEVTEAPTIVPIALAPHGMTGQCVHRDRLMPVLDAGALLGVPRANVSGVLLLIETEAGRAALCVDDVVDMVTVAQSQRRALPASGGAAVLMLAEVYHLADGIAGAVAMDALRAAMLARLTTEVG
jgi:chemotaxis signal transduction protein